MADSFLGDALMGLGQGLTGQPYLTNYEKLKQDAAQWRDQAAQRAAELQASQLSNSLTGAYLNQMAVDTSGVTAGGSIQPKPMLPQAQQQPPAWYQGLQSGIICCLKQLKIPQPSCQHQVFGSFA